MNAESSLPASTAVEEKATPSALKAWIKKRLWFIICVIIPTFIATIYYGFFAADIYISESRFVIKSPDQKRSSSSTLANLIQTTGLSGGQEQTNEVLAYVRSRDALKALEKNPEISVRLSAPNGDFLSRFPDPLSDNSFESLYKYYGKMVSSRLDTETGTAIITTKAFTAQDAYQMNQRLLQLSEDLVNRLNARAQTKGITEAQKQVDLATSRAKSARIALAEYRNAQALIDPATQATGVIGIANTMTAERAALQAQLETMQRLTPQNPSIPALRNRIDAISAQISSQDNRVTGAGSGIASKLGGYEDLLVEQEFATENLNVARAALVQARAESQKQQFYLERVVNSNLPDRPLLPRAFINILVIAAATACLYFIIWMLVVGIIEHAPDK